MSGEAAGAAPAPPKRKGVLALLRTLALVAAVLLAIFGLGTLASGPLFYRTGIMGLDAATTGVEQGAMAWFAVGLAFALFGLVVSLVMRSHKGVIVAVVSGIACGSGVGHLYSQGELRKDLPPIYDVQTDWTLPVAFSSETLAAREAAGAVRVRDDAVLPQDTGEWAGMPVATAQGKVYELTPLTVKVSPAEATLAAATAAKQLGWDVTLSDPQAGVVEAVSRTFWYGFVSDIAVRVTPAPEGSRIDIRSTSRLATPDLGANAAQVEALINEIALAER